MIQIIYIHIGRLVMAGLAVATFVFVRVEDVEVEEVEEEEGLTAVLFLGAEVEGGIVAESGLEGTRRSLTRAAIEVASV